MHDSLHCPGINESVCSTGSLEVPGDGAGVPVLPSEGGRNDFNFAAGIAGKKLPRVFTHLDGVDFGACGTVSV